MGRVLIEQNKFITGESQEFSEEDKAYTKNKGRFVKSMVNFEPADEEGNIDLSKGFSLIHDTGIRSPFQNIEFAIDDNGITRFIGAVSGNLVEISNWKDTPSHEIKSTALATSGFVDIIPVTKKITGSFENYLVILDGTECKKFDFTSLSQLATGIHKASFGIFANDVLFTNDMDEKALFRFSGALDPEDFTSVGNSGFVQLGTNTNPITGACPIFVPADNSTNIIVTKKNQTYAVSGTTTYNQYIFSEQIGARSPQGLIALGQEVIFCNNENITQLTALSYNGTLRPKNIANPIQKKYQSLINADAMQNSFIFNDKKNYKMYFMLPSTFEYPSIAYGLTPKLGFFRRDFYENQFTCSATDPDTGEIYLGDIYGRIFKFNSGYTYNGKSYTAYIEYGKTDFGSSKIKMGLTQAGDKITKIVAKVSEDVNISLETQKYSRSGAVQALETKDLVFKRKNEARYGRALYGQSTYSNYDIIEKSFELGVFDAINVTVKCEANGSPITIKELTLLAEEGIV